VTRPRILVVDDEASVLITLAANLELSDFDVVEADSGARALELVAEQKFDLVLSDIRMPGMNGLDLFREIRARDAELPVVLMTAFALEGLVQDAIGEGAFAVVSKPFEIDHLVQALMAAMRHPLVLIVDDDHPVADSLAAALHGAGLRARAVFDGASALQAVKDGATDVCVVDMVMPTMTGAELIEKIREIDSHIACIAISGHDVPGLFQRAADKVFTFMRKPIRPLELMQTIARARVPGKR
jgi:DNA-binding NtrC family response regulator